MPDIILSGFFVQRARGDYDYASFEEFLLDKQPDGGSLSGVQGERSFGAGERRALRPPADTPRM